jgi:hypothetical protein
MGGIEFPVRDGQWWTLAPSLQAELEQDYPAVSVAAELRKARAWLVANPRRRKTARGMPRFLVGWLNRANRATGIRRGDRAVIIAPPTWACPHDPSCREAYRCAQRQELGEARWRELFPSWFTQAGG